MIVKESLNFDRNKDNYSSFDIGKKYLLNKKNDEIEWNWYPKPESEEEIINIVSYPKEENPNLLIKISKIKNEDKEGFIAINNVKRPYELYPPTIYNDSEKALKNEKEYLDLYYDENEIIDR